MKPRKKKKRQFRQAFARFLQLLLPSRNGATTFNGKLNSVAILAQEKLGDCVLLTPLIRNLRRAYPDLEIHIIAFSRESATFFMNDPDVTAIHLAKKKPTDFIRNVLSRKFDLLFNTKDHPSAHFLLQSVLIPANFRVGHRNPFHEHLYDRLIDLDYHTHMSLKNCALLDVLGIHYGLEECRPSLSPQPLSDALHHFLSQLSDKKVTGINISAGEPNRTWPEKNWTQLLERFPNRMFVVLSGPTETELKINIERKCRNTLASPPTANLFEVLRIVEKLDLLITPDTSLIHIASATKTPIVGLYRQAPHDITRFGPYRIQNELTISNTGDVSGIQISTVVSAIKKMV
ncbi:MAG: glycosyltransferase family 9 protein [Chlorobium sp.]|uniref:glycosyltransferase family 9 protein n=1 Tax=Chlorobium sp. TaxID=1095 RepID=UPI002F40F1E3